MERSIKSIFRMQAHRAVIFFLAFGNQVQMKFLKNRNLETPGTESK